jgi:RNA polymerase sigma factor (sigma-70 family)
MVLMPEFFDREWSSMSRRIAGTLARRGVPASDREDILQETALRLFRSWDRLDPERAVEPYARVIASNIWRDQLRRGVNENPVEVLPETSSAPDTVENVCMMRDELSRVGRALKTLNRGQSTVLHTVIADELSETGTAPASDAVRMARMRARRQLRLALEVASGVAVASWGLACRLGRASLGNPTPAAMVSTAAGALVMILLTPAAPAGHTSPSDRSPGSSLAVAAPAAARMVARGPLAQASTADHATSRGWRPQERHHSAPAHEAPFRIQAGESSVSTYTRVDVQGHGVVVSQGGGTLPVCTFGMPDAPAPSSTTCRH